MATETKLPISEAKPWEKFYTREQIEAPVPECNLYEFLRDFNKNWLDIPALNYFDNKISYRTLLQDIDRAADAFAAAGVREGDYVSLCALTTPETVTAFYALNKLGAACNIIEPRTNPKRIGEHINHVHSDILVVLDVFVGKINEILPQLDVKKIVILSIARSMPAMTRLGFKLTKGRKLPQPAEDSRFILWDDFLSAGKGFGAASVPYKKDRPAAIVYTGGTTGVPKGAILSNDSFNTLTMEILHSGLEYEPGETFLNIMPPFIAYGISCGLNMHLSIGLTNIIIPAFDPEKFTSYILKYRPNHVMGVPAHFERLMVDPKMKGYDLSFVRDAATGGDVMPIGTEEKINAFLREHNCNHYIVRGYGMTELGSGATLSNDIANGPGSVGIPLPKVTFSVRDPETAQELGYNEHGELFCLAPTVMLGYYENPEEEANLFYTDEQGRRWVRSGDIGYIDEDGFIYIVGRKKRMIVRPDGHNVWPSQIEETASRFPGVKEVVVVGLKNPEGSAGRMPTAFIVPAEDALKTEDFLRELRTYIEDNLPGRDVPMGYKLLDTMPLTPIGKADYRALEQLPFDSVSIKV